LRWLAVESWVCGKFLGAEEAPYRVSSGSALLLLSIVQVADDRWLGWLRWRVGEKLFAYLDLSVFALSRNHIGMENVICFLMASEHTKALQCSTLRFCVNVPMRELAL
jgi:hypothetical protein